MLGRLLGPKQRLFGGLMQETVIEHHPVAKEYVVETRPLGERELVEAVEVSPAAAAWAKCPCGLWWPCCTSFSAGLAQAQVQTSLPESQVPGYVRNTRVTRLYSRLPSLAWAQLLLA